MAFFHFFIYFSYNQTADEPPELRMNRKRWLTAMQIVPVYSLKRVLLARKRARFIKALIINELQTHRHDNANKSLMLPKGHITKHLA